MFKVALIEDTLRVEPQDLGMDRWRALGKAVDARYADRVLPQVGLCLGLWDWVMVGEPRLLAGDAGSFTTCRFRLVVFEPFVGEIVTGVIAESSPAGIRVSLGFMEDIHVPSSALPKPSEFIATERAWNWKFEGNDLFMDLGSPVRVRIVRVVYDALNRRPPLPSDSGEKPESTVEPSAMVLYASMEEEGLGVLEWWDG